MTAQSNPARVNCEEIVSLIIAGDARGEEMLYNSFYRGLRYLATRECPQYAEDCVHDTLITVIGHIRSRQLREPGGLVSYLRTVLKRTAWSKRNESHRWSNGEQYDLAVQTSADPRQTPEQTIQSEERIAVMRAALGELKPREQEVLTRFYLKNETQETIREAMKLSETQFRLLKSRSKQKLQESVTTMLKRPVVAPSPLKAMIASAG